MGCDVRRHKCNWFCDWDVCRVRDKSTHGLVYPKGTRRFGGCGLCFVDHHIGAFFGFLRLMSSTGRGNIQMAVNAHYRPTTFGLCYRNLVLRQGKRAPPHRRIASVDIRDSRGFATTPYVDQAWVSSPSLSFPGAELLSVARQSIVLPSAMNAARLLREMRSEEFASKRM